MSAIIVVIGTSVYARARATDAMARVAMSSRTAIYDVESLLLLSPVRRRHADFLHLFIDYAAARRRSRMDIIDYTARV